MIIAKRNEEYNKKLALKPKEKDSFLWSKALKEGNKHFLDFINSDKKDGTTKLKFTVEDTSVHIAGEGKIKIKSIENLSFDRWRASS